MSANAPIISTLESIPNELLLEIYAYLSPFDIFQSFYFLNRRYNTLLRSLSLRIDLLNINKRTFDYYNYFLFTHVPHGIIAFRCEDIFDRLTYQIRLSNWSALKYLTISSLTLPNLQSVISQLSSLPKLIYLNLKTREETITETAILFQGQLSSIEKCLLNFNQPILFSAEYSYPNLQHLTLNYCTIEGLASFLQNQTPQLRKLTVTLVDGNLPVEINHTHPLQSLIIRTKTVTFRYLAKSVFILFPSLQQLTIDAIGIDYTNGKQWVETLSSNFPHLINFHLHITYPSDDADRSELLKTFQTSYFRSRRWHFASLHKPSMSTTHLFSLPMMNDKTLSFDLYNTQIEPSTFIDRNSFQHTQELTLFLNNPDENSIRIQAFFSKVQHLRLISTFQEHDPFPKMLFVDISHLVKLSRLKSIEFLGVRFPSTTLVFLDYTPDLHTLIIPLKTLLNMTKLFHDLDSSRRLTTLIKYLTITSIDDVKNLFIFEKFPAVCPSLQSLSLSIKNPSDLYILTVLILPKMSQILKSLTISLETRCDSHLLDRFMSWLMDYMHARDLDFADVKLVHYQVCFCF